MTERIEHIHVNQPTPDPVKIKIERGQKGGYGWEISIVGDDAENIIQRLKEADKSLRKNFLEAE